MSQSVLCQSIVQFPIIYKSILYSELLQPLKIQLKDINFQQYENIIVDLESLNELHKLGNQINMKYLTILNCKIYLIEQQIAGFDTCIFVYDSGIVLVTNQQLFTLFDSDQDLKIKEIEFLKQFDKLFEIDVALKRAIMFSTECSLLRLIQGSTHWLQTDKLMPKLMISTNQLFIIGSQPLKVKRHVI
ncbi:Hypothetical_protein [Hexamita inflata]|uniref:Hypothetical_protein n=1 Tax=Hexamita inflata TaxID=28002 RepID=A0AA86UCI2_9EUKA|nr:Hypothetical protein HINF_LOCUS33242 [Hexamita inflata]